MVYQMTFMSCISKTLDFAAVILCFSLHVQCILQYVSHTLPAVKLLRDKNKKV